MTDEGARPGDEAVNWVLPVSVMFSGTSNTFVLGGIVTERGRGKTVRFELVIVTVREESDSTGLEPASRSWTSSMLVGLPGVCRPG